MRRLVALAPVLLVSGCAGPQNVLDPASDQASQLHTLMNLMLVVCGLAYILLMAFLAAALWRARGQLGGDPVLRPDDRRLDRGLGAWAAFITVGLAVLAGGSFLVDRALANKAVAAAPTVRVTGQQWWWRIEYLDPATGRWIETANELHLPLNTPTRVQILSADVIHSFWIPNLSGKIDMVPGRSNAITMTPRRAGWFRGQCAEFCGLQHAEMALDVKVETPQEFQTWLAAQGQPVADVPETEDRGQTLVTTGSCANCHTIRGTRAKGRAGPDLTHVASRRSLAAGTAPLQRSTLMGWITQPQAMKPGNEMPATPMTPADALALAGYLEGLR
jgi:cytochrome c oxidase subunit 2